MSDTSKDNKLCIYKRPWCSLVIKKTHQTLVQNWKGFSMLENFQEVAASTIGAFKKYHPKFLITDSSQLQIVTDDELKVAGETIQQLTELGLKRIAFVMPVSLKGRRTIIKLKEKFPKGFFEFFETKEHAQQWLNNEPVT